MECQLCAYPDTEVVSTRQNELRKRTERRRQCLRCGQRFTTHEKFREQKLDAKGVPIEKQPSKAY